MCAGRVNGPFLKWFGVLHVQKAQQLAQLGIPLAERVLLPFILELTRGLQSGLSWAGKGREVNE